VLFTKLIENNYRQNYWKWFTMSLTRVKWGDQILSFYKQSAGVRPRRVYFFTSFNSIFSKVGICAPEELSGQRSLLMFTFQMYYSPTTRRRGMSFFIRDKHSSDFSLTRIFMKHFRTASAVVVSGWLLSVRNYSAFCVWNIKLTFVLRASCCILWQQRILFVICLPYKPLE